VDGRGMLALKYLIIAGDLNFTIRAGEVWGDSTHLDLMVAFLKDIFMKN